MEGINYEAAYALSRLKTGRAHFAYINGELPFAIINLNENTSETAEASPYSMLHVWPKKTRTGYNDA